MVKVKSDVSSFLREDAFPTIWCAGCGHGIVMKAAIRAIKETGWMKDEIIAVSGIGCSSRVPSYCDFYGIQTTHGRAIAFATGMAMSRPDMHVVLFLGDGDCCAIGGNHLIHAAKRNFNMTVIVMNNHIYGMTGGQVSPTTHYMDITATSPYGNIEPELNVCGVVMAAGATFVARTTAYHVNQMMRLFEQGLANKGFSLIECIDPCPTSYGRRNKYKTPVEMYEWLKDNSIPVQKAETLSEDELKGKVVTGILKDKPRNDFNLEYAKLVEYMQSNVKPDDSSLKVQNFNGADEFKRTELLLTGSGGQGLITAGIILAEAAIRYGIKATHSQSYGPEARGGASRSEVILSHGDVYFPEVKNPDILLAMTQQSFDKYAVAVKSDGLIIADTTYVKDLSATSGRVYGCPITERIIAQLGSAICANVASLGMLACFFPMIDFAFFEKAVSDRVPPAFLDMNIKALRAGYKWAEELYDI